MKAAQRTSKPCTDCGARIGPIGADSCPRCRGMGKGTEAKDADTEDSH